MSFGARSVPAACWVMKASPSFIAAPDVALTAPVDVLSVLDCAAAAGFIAVVGVLSVEGCAVAAGVIVAAGALSVEGCAAEAAPMPRVTAAMQPISVDFIVIPPIYSRALFPASRKSGKP